MKTRIKVVRNGNKVLYYPQYRFCGIWSSIGETLSYGARPLETERLEMAQWYIKKFIELMKAPKEKQTVEYIDYP